MSISELEPTREKSLRLARQFEDKARAIYFDMLAPYGNALALTDTRATDLSAKEFVIRTWEEYKLGVAFDKLTSWRLTFDAYGESDQFASSESHFISAADEFYGAIKCTLLALIEHRKNEPQRYRSWPQSQTLLRAIGRAIESSDFAHAHALKQAAEGRLTMFQRGQDAEIELIKIRADNPFGLPENKDVFDRADIHYWAQQNGLGGGKRNLNKHLFKIEFDQGECIDRATLTDFLRKLSAKSRGAP